LDLARNFVLFWQAYLKLKAVKRQVKAPGQAIWMLTLLPDIKNDHDRTPLKFMQL